jgi:hypothetical protein
MGSDVNRPSRTVSDQLHPLVWMAIVGLALWFVLSVWGFAGDGYTDYLLAVVSGFVFVAVTIPYLLWRVVRRGQRPDAAAPPISFRDWSSGEFATGQDRVRGTNAAVEILMPIAAAAFGMTAFGIVSSCGLVITPAKV